MQRLDDVNEDPLTCRQNPERSKGYDSGTPFVSGAFSLYFCMPYFEFMGAEVDREILTSEFACNLSVCRGACCTVPGGRGAPVREDEVAVMEAAARLVGPMLSERHTRVLEREGPLEGPIGDRTTVCVDGGACVFVAYENSIAFCTIEKLHRLGHFPWKKPLSCHLYPIRVDQGSPPRIRYEEARICQSAKERGRREQTPLLDFLTEALTRAYGPEWLSALRSWKNDR